ncbi:Hypothetical protein Ccan_03480 [Capnocytophaga canimorsus Cc5]|uniref:Uncharacterized protein n=1 Tax=Capnocytophaga canimorsus (strain 5) TaxID=860228 RepID=F9YRB2_CAPCC|nr:Hypothetical protein Ccan_03480 [Capnocytophaga canimorsus Cc5]
MIDNTFFIFFEIYVLFLCFLEMLLFDYVMLFLFLNLLENHCYHII